MRRQLFRVARACIVGAGLGIGGLTGAMAQGVAPPPPQNVVQLSASATLEVLPDLTTIVLGITREGNDAATVQSQLKATLESALNDARKGADKGKLDVRTGNFSLYPRHGRDGKIAGWQGQAELILEGHDGSAIAALAGRLGGLAVTSVQHGLSRDLRQRTEAQVQSGAIDRFKAKAADISRAFGFSGYGLREIQISGQEPAPFVRQRMVAMAAAAPVAEAPVPVEAGRIAVTVTVSGTVQMR